ncbi:MAG: hypothetical protein WC602_02035 [archaeon]
MDPIVLTLLVIIAAFLAGNILLYFTNPGIYRGVKRKQPEVKEETLSVKLEQSEAEEIKRLRKKVSELNARLAGMEKGILEAKRLALKQHKTAGNKALNSRLARVEGGVLEAKRLASKDQKATGLAGLKAKISIIEKGLLEAKRLASRHPKVAGQKALKRKVNSFDEKIEAVKGMIAESGRLLADSTDLEKSTQKSLKANVSSLSRRLRLLESKLERRNNLRG